MFGCIVAGKPVLSDPIPVSETQGLITIPYPPNEVRHVVLFLTSPLPNPGVELGAAVHLRYSAEGSTEMQWVYLGVYFFFDNLFYFLQTYLGSRKCSLQLARIIRIAQTMR